MPATASAPPATTSRRGPRRAASSAGRDGRGEVGGERAGRDEAERRAVELQRRAQVGQQQPVAVAGEAERDGHDAGAGRHEAGCRAEADARGVPARGSHRAVKRLAAASRPAWRSTRKRSTISRLASASETSPRATRKSGRDSRSAPTGCQCAPSAVIVSSGTMTASETCDRAGGGRVGREAALHERAHREVVAVDAERRQQSRAARSTSLAVVAASRSSRRAAAGRGRPRSAGRPSP